MLGGIESLEVQVDLFVSRFERFIVQSRNLRVERIYFGRRTDGLGALVARRSAINRT